VIAHGLLGVFSRWDPDTSTRPPEPQPSPGDPKKSDLGKNRIANIFVRDPDVPRDCFSKVRVGYDGTRSHAAHLYFFRSSHARQTADDASSVQEG
jgi:hypothetical protein